MTSMINKNTKPNRIFPVLSAINPTTNGPRNEADLSVNANKEKKDDSWPCLLANSHLQHLFSSIIGR